MSPGVRAVLIVPFCLLCVLFLPLLALWALVDSWRRGPVLRRGGFWEHP